MQDSVWEELRKIEEEEKSSCKEAYFNSSRLEKHSHHKSEMGIEDTEEYNEVTHILTSYPALPLGKGEIYDVQGYLDQRDVGVKFVQYKGKLYILSSYRDDPVTGEALTCHVEPIGAVLRKADPYRFYRKTNKQGDYRYKCDLDGKFEGLKFFDKHSEYHRDTPPERVKEIRRMILAGKPLENFNTDKE